MGGGRGVFQDTFDKFLGLLTNGDYFAGANLVGGNRYDLTVNGEMTVADKLSGLSSGGNNTGAVHQIVQTSFQKLQELEAGRHFFLPGGLLKISRELRFEHAIGVTYFLLFSQLQGILGLLFAVLAMLSWTITAPLDGALGGVAARALEEELSSLIAAKLAN